MKGQQLRIKIGNPAKCVAFSTSCTYHLNHSLEDASTKDTESGFQKQAITGTAGDISCDALYSVGSSDTTGISGEQALDLMLAGQEVDVEFTPTEGEKNRASTGTPYTCKALVNDISINAPNRQNVTYSIQMQMNSKPVKGSSADTD